MAEGAAVHGFLDLVVALVNPVFHRIPIGPLEIGEARSMEFVIARFQHDADGRTGTVPVFGVGRVLQDVDFLHHVGCWNIARLHADTGGTAVHLQVVRKLPAASDFQVIGCPGVIGVVFPPRSALHRGIQLRQQEDVAIHLRQALHQLLTHVAFHLGGVELQSRRFGADRNRFGNISGLQDGIYRQIGPGGY